MEKRLREPCSEVDEGQEACLSHQCKLGPSIITLCSPNIANIIPHKMNLPIFDKFDGIIDLILYLTHFKLSMISTSVPQRYVKNN